MDSQLQPQPVVLQVLIPGTRPAFDVFGAWQGQMGPVDDGVGAVWQADLPEDDLWAEQLLRTQSRSLHTASMAIPVAERRLAADLAAVPDLLPAEPGARFQAGSSGAAFVSVPGSSGSESLGAFNVLLTAHRYSLQSQGLSFSTNAPSLSTGELEQTGDRFEQFISQLRCSVGQLALVKTSSMGSPVATSRVDWFGNVQTWWAACSAPERCALHASVLNQALVTRQNWLRFALLVTGGAVRVGAALAAGPLGLLSIWTTWNYVQRVIDEFRRLGSSPTR